VKDAFIAYRDHASAYKKELDESALYNLITAEKGENIDAYISTYSFDKYYGVNYYLMLFFFQQPLGGESQPVISANGKNSDFKKLMFHSAMEEITKTDPFLNIECCSSHHVQIAVIWGEKDHVTTEIIEKIALNASDILSEGCNEKVTAAISSPVDKPADFSKAYKEAVQIHQFAVSVNSKASIVSSERVKKDSGQLLTGEYIRKEQILINTILARKYESVPDMCDSIARQHIIPLSNEYQLANRRFESLKNILDEGVRASTIQGFEREKPLSDLAECKEIESLILLARDIYEKMAEFSEQEDSNSAIADAALRFVAHNLFDQNLTVSMICEAIDVSPQKLTRIFKSSQNMAVAEYVNYCRIEKAKELLTSTDDTTIVIAEKIGYNNSDTFTRNFKKMEGITPSDYRKSKN
jgi:YesN/AraC family two-component response regulator